MTGTLTTRLSGLITAPPTIAHELTHGVLALPWARQLVFVFEPDTASASVGVDWVDDAPTWAIVLAHFGPLL